MEIMKLLTICATAVFSFSAMADDGKGNNNSNAFFPSSVIEVSAAGLCAEAAAANASANRATNSVFMVNTSQTTASR